jgi:hypothetical protein
MYTLKTVEQSNVARRLGYKNVFNAKHPTMHYRLETNNPEDLAVLEQLCAMAGANELLKNLHNVRVTPTCVATPQAARGWAHPPCRHFKNQSCCCLGCALEVAAFQTLMGVFTEQVCIDGRLVQLRIVEDATIWSTLSSNYTLLPIVEMDYYDLDACEALLGVKCPADVEGQNKVFDLLARRALLDRCIQVSLAPAVTSTGLVGW